MNTPKGIFNKTQYPFADSISAQQSQFFKNVMIPAVQQQRQMMKRSNVFYGGNEHYYYPKGNGANNLNGNHFYEKSQQMNSGAIGSGSHNNIGRQRFAPYPFYKRSYAHTLMQSNQRVYNYQMQTQQQGSAMVSSNLVNSSEQNASPTDPLYSSGAGQSTVNGFNGTMPNLDSSTGNSPFDTSMKSSVTLQISNLDTTIEENELKQFLINRLKPITTVISIYFESMSIAKIKLPSDHQARQVIAQLHRKKIGHKRITVSYFRESSTLDSSTLRCQVAGLLKDIPNYKLSMYKFRELFQSRFKTSISVIDLHEMKDICTIIGNKNEEFITLRTELIDSIENSELMEYFQHSVPYCTLHFVKTHRGWAEQEIDPLPNVQMTISQARDIIFALLKNHKGVIPIASIVHCIQSDLNITLERNESGVNFEHLISCIQGVQITSNKFNIKILSWSNGKEMSPKEKDQSPEEMPSNRYLKYGNIPDSFTQISREITELIKLSPKATLKFSRFIPAYHNHFGKQCRVADYGYTKLIDLFEALSSVVQVMGEGENRQITLTHRIQMQRFKTDLLRILRTQSSKSFLLSNMAIIFEQVQCRKFNITDYGVCDINDILDGLVNTNVIVVNSIPHIMDTMISIPKRKQSTAEVDKTSNFAAEVIELFKHASQYTILFEKFACSYHYHFGYQCRLSDYGFLKLADLMEAIAGVVEMEFSNEEDRKIFLSPKTAQRIFSEQLRALVETHSGSSDTLTNLHEILIYHKKQYGYQMLPQSLGFDDMLSCIKSLPYIEVISANGFMHIKCHHDNPAFREIAYASVRLLLEDDHQILSLVDFTRIFADKYNETLDKNLIKAMKHAIEIQYINNVKCVTLTKMMRFVIQIIKVIETQGTIKLLDLSNALKLSIKACFPFGYPNLVSFIQAFPDIFVLQLSSTNSALSEITVNSQCLLSKQGLSRYPCYITDNNNNNNNEPGTINYNKKMSFTLNGSFEESATCLSLGNESLYKGAASLALQATLQTSSLSSNSHLGSLEMNIHPSFDSISMIPSLNSSTLNDFEARYAMNSKMLASESFESYNAGALNGIDLNSNIISSKLNNSNGVNYHESTQLPIGLDSQQVASFCYRDTDLGIGDNGTTLNALGKDISFNRKRKLFGGPPKPDSPPATPYWNNPIWGGDVVVSPPLNVRIDIPDLTAVNAPLMLDSPLVMAKLAKTNHFSFISNKSSM